MHRPQIDLADDYKGQAHDNIGLPYSFQISNVGFESASGND